MNEVHSAGDGPAPTDSDSGLLLRGVKVLESADEQAEYVGMILAGMGATVIKVEPPGGSSTRRIGPFLDDIEDPEASLYFWQYNRGKRSICLDPESAADQKVLDELVAGSDVLLASVGGDPHMSPVFDVAAALEHHPHLIAAIMSPFGVDGPWSAFKGSDLVHLALGGEMMCSGYSPPPDADYDEPPVAGQMWHSYHIAGEQLVMGILTALYHREATGEGQQVHVAVHNAVAKNTELDIMNWVMLRQPIYRQTCSHANKIVGTIPPMVSTKDGRWFMLSLIGQPERARLLRYLVDKYGVDEKSLPEDATQVGGTNSRTIPGSSSASEAHVRLIELTQRIFRRYSYANAPWREMQDAGIMIVPVRRPEENFTDEHWRIRGTYAEISHPSLDRAFPYVVSKWLSNETRWQDGPCAPSVGGDSAAIRHELLALSGQSRPTAVTRAAERSPGSAVPDKLPRKGALDGVRIFDFSWFLASAGGTRFLAAMGAEVIKVEWSAHPDTRMAAMAPIGGRPARNLASAPLEGVDDSDMGGQFNNKNSGKRGISLNVRHPQGLKIARRLIAMSDIVAEGFSPGVLGRWGLGYKELCAIKPDIIYAQQSGMGAKGSYGRFRAVGPIAASLSGITEMSGLPEPAMPAGWGYSYLDWIGAYSFANAMLGALYYRERTGRGQWIDASQTETGLFVGGTSLLDYAANGRRSARYGNRSPWKKASPSGAYPCSGEDRWIAISCVSDAQWIALTNLAGRPDWAADERFGSVASRLAHQDALDVLVGSWTMTKDRYELMYALQAAGVPAGVCQDAEDKYEHDPQLAHLNWLTEVTGTKIGTWPVYELPIEMSTTPPHIGGPTNRGAPIYGEDNEYIFGELLGMSTSEIAGLVTDGVIEEPRLPKQRRG